MILPITQKTLFPQISYSNIVTQHFSLKKLLNICHTDGSRIASCFAMLLNALESSRSSNRAKSNEICLKFRLCKVFLDIWKTASVILQKMIFPAFFVEFFLNNIHNLKIKTFYQNHGHIFVQVVKISCQYHEIYATMSLPKLRIFFYKLKLFCQTKLALQIFL